VEFPRGKVVYESYHPSDYLRIAPDTKSVAFAEFVAVTAMRGGQSRGPKRKELIHSEVFVSVEAWLGLRRAKKCGCRNHH